VISFRLDVIHSLSLSLSPVFCCRAGSGYPVLGNSRGGFPLPSSQFVITYCDQSFPSPWHCCPRHPPYPVLPSCPLSRAFPYLQPGDAGGRHSAPAVCQSLVSADPTVIHYADTCYDDDNIIGMLILMSKCRVRDCDYDCDWHRQTVRCLRLACVVVCLSSAVEVSFKSCIVAHDALCVC